MDIENKASKYIKIELNASIPGKEEGQEINRIRLEKFKAKHLKFLPTNLESPKPYEFIPLIAGLAGLPTTSIDEMELEDLYKVIGVVESFLEKSHPTGKN